MIVLVGRNLGYGDELYSKMEEIALKNKVSIIPFNTGRMDTGIDLASSDANPLHAPRVALVVDQPFNSPQVNFGIYWIIGRNTVLAAFDPID